MLLTRKERRFEWEGKQKQAFNELKDAFTTAPVLARFDFKGDTVVDTDASDYVSAGVLLQYDDQGILHPFAFFSKQHTPAEWKYGIYDKELLAVYSRQRHFGGADQDTGCIRHW